MQEKNCQRNRLLKGHTIIITNTAPIDFFTCTSTVLTMDVIHTIANSSEKEEEIIEAVNASHSNRTISRIESDDVGVFHAQLTTSRSDLEGTAAHPVEILPYVEPEVQPSIADEDDSDEEDDYEYEDDDETPFSGFLVDNPSITSTGLFAAATEDAGRTAPATIRDEDETQADVVETIVESTAPIGLSRPSHSQKWRQPSKEAVSMSLRAGQETSGGRRRLAQDLYRIMNQDTQEAGFSLEPSEADSMNKWTIKLFQFDEDSNLAKDMLVLGLKNIELEMSFPDQYPFEPPFVRVVKPRFKRQTGFVMNGAICMELLTKVCVRLLLPSVVHSALQTNVALIYRMDGAL
jgi:ubiquitin-protein ligase